MRCGRLWDMEAPRVPDRQDSPGETVSEDQGLPVAHAGSIALTRRFGDLDIAEEAAAEAFATAVGRWPADGVPPNPGAWLTTTANRSGEHPRPDLVADRLHHLLPGRLTTTRVNSEERHVPVLDEPLPGAPGIAAPPQLRGQEVEQGPAELSDLQVPESGLDHPPDVDLVRLPGRQVPVGDLGVPIHQLRHGGVRLGLAPRRGLLEQLAEFDLRGPFGLTGLPQADLPARQRISPGVDTYAERTAGELLNVTACGLGHDSTLTRLGVSVPQPVPRPTINTIRFPR